MSVPRRQAQALTPFAERMQMARKRIGLTQSQAAEQLGLTQPTVSSLEIDGERSAYLPAIARLYGVDVYWLYSGEGEMLTGGRRFSVEAEDLARRLDAIEDPDVKRRVYALSQLVADLGTLPSAVTAPLNSKSKPEVGTSKPRASRSSRHRVSKSGAADSPEPTGIQTPRRRTRA